ncbi:MAG: hypothetical protein F6J99_05625 [Moorea sp. SIO4G3]|uniref:hypothetical protein n=1 Tax=Moorena producens TaxID=1155739 RepID=UPI0011EA66C3|nr:hypothetical protein [Moorena producens]NEO75759.1 hypothetical protein [Moorena sp. SIO4G3]
MNSLLGGLLPTRLPLRCHHGRQFYHYQMLKKAMQSAKGGFHGAFKVRTQVTHAAPPQERLHQERKL